MNKFFPIFALFFFIASSPAFADEYDMSSFDSNRRSAGLSSFRITPDMYPKHSYRRKVLMQTYGPKGKPVGFSQIKGKAFDYLNGESLNDSRNKARASDIYLDKAYQSPIVDRKYDPAYHRSMKVNQSNGLKPMGPKHTRGDNPFNGLSNTNKLFSTKPAMNQNGKFFTNDKIQNKFQNQSIQPSQNYKVFDDESMF